MKIESTAAAGVVPATPMDVSPDQLLSFLEVRLGEIDVAITADIRAVEAQSNDSSAISKKRELLDQIANQIRMETDKPKKKIALVGLEVTWEGKSCTAEEALRRAGLLESISTKEISGGKETKLAAVTLESIEADSSRLEKEQKRLTSDNDLRMLRLQDMMNRRSQLVQMVSNFLRSILDAERNIVGNIR